MLKSFEQDTREFRPVPFWVWDAGCQEDEIIWQLREMRDKGIYEVIIMPSYGMEPVCFSDLWWKKMAFVAGECKKLGMKVWLYDEYNWPSGHAAGFVLKRHPWTMCRKLYFKIENARKGHSIKTDILGEIVVARIISGNKTSELTDYSVVSEGKKKCFVWTADCNGKLFLLMKEVGRKKSFLCFGALWTWNQEGALDVLNPKAVRKFIEISYAGGEKYLSKYFGNVIRGVFTDEPGILYGSLFPDLPFTEGLFEIFKKRYGYSLPDKIHHLVLDSPDCYRTRYDYWSLITNLFSESYNRQIADWCKKRGLLFTGHYLSEEWLSGSVVANGDIYQAAKHMHVPGIDLLETETSFEKKDPRNAWSASEKNFKLTYFNITGKLLTSTAKYTGAQRVLCEAFGISPWDLTLEKMKKLTDWLVAMGVNLINDNLIPYSLKGFRRMMGCKNFTSGWWKDYKVFADYCSRICRMTAAAPEKTEVGILYPTTSSWCMVNGQSNNPLLSDKTALVKIQETLYGLCDFLMRSHLQFDFLFDDVITGGSIKNGTLNLAPGSYKVIILPGLRFITKEVAAKLKVFAEQGGTLVLLGACPGTISRTGLINNIELKKALRLTNKDMLKKLADIIRRKIDVGFSIEGAFAKQIISSYREKKEEGILFVSNIYDKPNRVQISFRKDKKVEVWDPTTGKRYCLGVNKVSYQFEPYESRYFYLGKKTAERSIKEEYQYCKKESVIGLSKNWGFSTMQHNICLLDSRIRYDVDGRGMKQNWQQTRGWQEWEKVVNCSCSRNLDPGDMKYYWLAGEFNLTCPPVEAGRIYLIVDGEQKKDVFINNVRVATSKPCIVWDRENRSFDLTANLKQGKNIVVFRSPTSSYLSKEVIGEFSSAINPRDVEPLVIQGRFGVFKKQGVIRIIKLRPEIRPGSWTSQGYPNFSGTGIYKQDFSFAPAKGRRYWLDLGNVRDTVEIILNSKKVSTLAWHPFRTEITGFLKAGRNRIELRVSNNFGNLLKKFYGRVLDDKPIPAGLLAAPVIYVTN